jgi:aminomethyltransferase
LHKLKLHDLHASLGGKMVPFAGYEMPVQYSGGVMQEHLHTRAAAGLFDVSHMGQVQLRPKVSMEHLALAIEALMPVDVLSLAPGRQRYGMFTNDSGGILDDLMLANRGDHFLVVVNAACKASDLAHMQKHLKIAADVVPVTDRALIALQGPLAETALVQIVPQVAQMRFMDSAVFGDFWISRSGYTGEDGFEISLPNDAVEAFVSGLLRMPQVMPIGLGARDSLRLEAGLCLYGHDIDQASSPVEAGLSWAIQKSRRLGGDRAGGFPGAARILDELSHGTKRLRVGIRPDGRAPMRESVPLFSGTNAIGVITSGGFGPSIGAPIAMGYVAREHAQIGAIIQGDLRGKMLPARIVSLPFQPTTFKR